MSAARIFLLGAIAWLTTFLGLPIGRARNLAPRLRALLNAAAAGIGLFLLWDVLAHAWEPVDATLSKHDYGPAVGKGLVLAAGIVTGPLGLTMAYPVVDDAPAVVCWFRTCGPGRRR